MSLRNWQINDLINDCDYYREVIERPEYLEDWVERPEFSYNDYKKCRELEQIKLTSHPVRREDDITNIFDYKTLQPRRRGRLSLSEHFGLSQARVNYNLILQIVSLILIAVLGAHFFINI